MRIHAGAPAIILALLLGSAAAAEEPAADARDAQVQQVLDRLMAGWNAGRGDGFAAAFAEDADFVPYFGAHIQGRDAIAAAHQPAFDGFLKGSTLRYRLQDVRPLADGVLLVHTLGSVSDRTEGAAQAEPTAIQTFVMVEREGALVIESFQNTTIADPPGGP